ncbi:hypothetical protein C2W62_48010, partial [Candidatus Entotheonella serta]
MIDEARDTPSPDTLPYETRPLDHQILQQLEQDVGSDIFGTIVDLHISEITENITSISSELNVQPLEVIERYAHNLRTSAASIGASRLAQHAQ